MKFQILGPLTVERDGDQVTLCRGREQTVLATLLLYPNRLVPLIRLVEAIWDDYPPDTATKAVRNCISTLRSYLVRAGAPDELIVTHPGGYLLRVEHGQLDAQLFDDRVAQARQLAATGQPRPAVQQLRAALSLWRGPALAGLGGRMIEAAAAGLNERRLAVVEDRLSLELELGMDRELIDELASLVADHPVREQLRGKLMLALYRAGRRTEALAAYREGRRTMVDELGIEPGSELRQLEQAILTDDPVLSEAVSKGHRTSPPAPAQLPADVPGFVGRATHLRTLDATLDPRSDRHSGPMTISIIAGTPGVGKTTLAVHWAHRVRDRFPDGQLFVDLRGYSAGPPKRSIEALTTFLHALGVPADQIPLDVESAAALFRTVLADRHLLILLDNAASPDQVRPLLPGSPGSLVLITSRDRLAGLVAKENAKLITLDVMTTAEANVLLTDTVGEGRTSADAAATADLAHACACLPLALRIAAANLVSQPHRSIGDYVAELREGNRLAGLQVDDDDQAAVRAAFDQSYATLAADARRLFRRLGLVPGRDVTADAAAVLDKIPPADAARLLDRLAAANLVSYSASRRVMFHDLLRGYAADRAQAEDCASDRQEAIQRLHDWYLAAVGDAARLLYPQMLRLTESAAEPVPSVTAFNDRSSALAWLDAERPNLVAAVLHAAEHGPMRSACLLADALRGYFHLRRGHGADWLAVACACLGAATTDRDLRAQATAELSLADAHQRQSRYQPAIEHYTRALTLNQQAQWLDGRGVVLGNLGFVYWQIGHLRKAVQHINEALAITRTTHRAIGTAVNLINLGAAYRQLGLLSEARASHHAALDIHRQIGSRLGEAMALGNLAETYHELDELERASDCANSALSIHREVGDRGNEAEVLCALAMIHRDEEQLNIATEYARAALALSRDTGDRRIEVGALNTLATIEQRLLRHADAITHHQQALELAEEINTAYQQAVALVELAAAHNYLRHSRDALSYATRALAVARASEFRSVEGQALVILAEIQATDGDLDEARSLSRQALAVLEQSRHRSSAAVRVKVFEADLSQVR